MQRRIASAYELRQLLAPLRGHSACPYEQSCGDGSKRSKRRACPSRSSRWVAGDSSPAQDLPLRTSRSSRRTAPSVAFAVMPPDSPFAGLLAPNESAKVGAESSMATRAAAIESENFLAVDMESLPRVL